MTTLGHAFRRLGSIVGIEHTRDEDEVRTDHHGGPVDELRARQEAYTEKVNRAVSKRDAKL